MVKRYLQLTKPGIIFGNLVSTAGGFFLAARGNISLALLLATMAGVSLVIACGCVFNNYIDRDIDGEMKRTCNRALVQGLIAPSSALVYASILGIAGICVLYFAANPLSAALAVAGLIVYIGFYSLYMKRHSVMGTLVGSLSGAMPPVIGYCAVSDHFDMAAFLLLVIFSLWQMPHSYAIAILYLDDYAAAGIPVLPVKMGVPAAKRHIVLYTAAFSIAALLPTLAGYTGYVYLAGAGLLGGYWLHMALSGFRATDERGWARRMFLFSIIIVMALSLLLSVDFSRAA
ncbi:MAG: heme o synthase [Alphaproteobacteria bacterium]|nr:heme o synthase [Alphaproteobacteria bacterium]